MITVARVVVNLNPAFHPEGKRFLVKDYPKDGEWRQLKISTDLNKKLVDFATSRGLGPDDLFFEYVPPTEPKRRKRPEQLPDPITLGWTEPHPKSGGKYRHGTISAYSGMKCRCQYCRDAMAAYRAERRAIGKDAPAHARHRHTDGHIDGQWFRTQVFYPAVQAAGIPFKFTPKSMRHAHASWILAGGADIQIAKERLGHGSIITTEKYLRTLARSRRSRTHRTQQHPRTTRRRSDPEPTPEAAIAEERTPDLAELMKMMATIKNTVERLSA